MLNKAFVYATYNKLFVDTDMYNKKFKSFGEWLRHHINLSGLSNAEVGRRVDVSGTYIGNLIRDFSPNSKTGKIRASEEVVEKLAQLFSCDLDEVRDYAGYSPTSPENLQLYLAAEFPYLKDRYPKLSEKGKEFIKRQVEAILDNLLEYESDADDTGVANSPLEERKGAALVVALRPDQIGTFEKHATPENTISLEEVREIARKNEEEKKASKKP